MRVLSGHQGVFRTRPSSFSQASTNPHYLAPESPPQDQGTLEVRVVVASQLPRAAGRYPVPWLFPASLILLGLFQAMLSSPPYRSKRIPWYTSILPPTLQPYYMPPRDVPRVPF